MAARTDRHNNPTAFTTDVAKTAGLVYGKDYVQGDPFPNNPNLYTATILGDPIETTIRAIDNMGFYTQSGKPRWTYIAMPQSEWLAKSRDEKEKIIKQMYKQEGGTQLFGAKKSYQEFAQAIKAKYPEYKSADDLTLAKAIIAKYPEYKSSVSLPDDYNPTPFSDPSTSHYFPPTTPTQALANNPELTKTVNNVDKLVASSGNRVNQYAGKLADEINNPSVGVRTAFKLPKEIVKEGSNMIYNFISPELKGTASGLRAIESTPEVASQVGGLLKDLWQGNFINKKTGNKVSRTEAFKDPVNTISPSAVKHTKKAKEIMAKPLLGQKTMAGSSTKDNLETAAGAALQALGAKYPTQAKEALGVLKSGGSGTLGVLKSGLNLGSKAVKAGSGLLKTGGIGLLGYLLGKK